ncbi:hypothetical protein B0E47_04420 [Rhodanobacter sp. B05]|jgi:hypothetical protein|nr:hypothetical protein B0E47_04420 [Rhodanobacter sp. B05]
MTVPLMAKTRFGPRTIVAMNASVSCAFAAWNIFAICGRIACSAADKAGCAQALPANKPMQTITTTATIFFMCVLLVLMDC